MLHFNKETRKLTADSGYIHRLDDTLYSTLVFLGKLDRPENYEEGNKEDYDKWIEEHYPPEPEPEEPIEEVEE